MSSGNDAIASYDHSTDGYLTLCQSSLSLSQSATHKIIVI